MARYYPKSQLQINLFTNGGEYIIEQTGQSYQGAYYKTSTNEYFAGNTPESGDNRKLIPTEFFEGNILGVDSPLESSNKLLYVEGYDGDLPFITPNSSINNGLYNLLTLGPSLPPVKSTPLFLSPSPTLNDYKIGEFQRYFLKRTNNLLYLEIDFSQFQQYVNQDPLVTFNLYNPISIPWNLTGDEKQVYQSNKKIVELAERENNWYGFTSYFQKDFSKYYNPIKENLFTSGGEYTTKDGKEYIGDYHIHPDKGPMVGAVHVSYPHDYLFPIMSPTGSIKQPSTPLTTPTTPSYSPPSTSGGGGGY